MKKKISIRSGMVGMLLVCWFIPFLMVAVMAGYYMFGNQFEDQLRHEMESMSFNNGVCAQRLEYAVGLSRDLTYEGSVNQALNAYRKKEISRADMLQTCSYQLYRLYNHEDCIQDAILWLAEDSEAGRTSTYNERTGGGYRHIQDYWEKDHETVSAMAEELDTGIRFYESDGRFYLIRNLVNSSYKRMATLVLRLDPRYCFDNLSSLAEESDVTVYVNDSVFILQGEKALEWEDVRDGEEGRRGYYWHNSKLGLYDVEKSDSFTITAMVMIKNARTLMPFYGSQFLLIGMVILLIPLLLLALYFIRTYVNRPVENLMESVDEIEKGNLGYQIEEIQGATEFSYLAEHFNKMSEQLKYQFDHIYEEEIALRDAKIMALQSHINPHFMNNTLEIINWEARLNGDDKVSEMIEALSTLMDATIDRKRCPEVTLSEEMQYVNAYLRILKERLGKRLEVRIELPEEIMGYQVPRLILQPIIENAIEHGAERLGNGSVILTGRQEGEYLYLEVYNNGQMSKKELQRVERLLDPDYDTSKESSGSMGIANVNQRLRILYGDPCGLTMENFGDHQVRTCLTIRVRQR